MTKNVPLFFIRPYGQDIQVKLFFLVHIIPQVFVSECLALFRRKRLLVHINPQVFVSECLALFGQKRSASATVDAVIFMTKKCPLFFIRPYGQDIQVKLCTFDLHNIKNVSISSILLVHINPHVSVSEFFAPIRRVSVGHR
ncbi:hypothetical protein M9H77_24052 [Catharanthus roseus]|uniref:Uncharacterized protein n=1 Tax=Catharanthus roseus TaxID=4058 RepID=A0ACC0AVZ2_CATRO|nr:hypothetical protein M9H77_24052 [Catharanthus roseus]